MTHRDVAIEVHGSVQVARIDRPKSRNALRSKTRDELHALLSLVESDESVAAVLLTGSGAAFSAGNDLFEARATLESPDLLRQSSLAWRDLLSRIEAFPKPVVAALNGVTVAGGLELALACDFIVCSSGARVGDGHAKYGLTPGFGGSVRLAEAVGRRVARWLLYSGQLLTAVEAQNIGLVQMVLPESSFEEAAIDAVREIADNLPTTTLLSYKQLTQRDGSIDRGIMYELEMSARLNSQANAQEGVNAFLEGRPPNFWMTTNRP